MSATPASDSRAAGSAPIDAHGALPRMSEATTRSCAKPAVSAIPIESTTACWMIRCRHAPVHTKNIVATTPPIVMMARYEMSRRNQRVGSVVVHGSENSPSSAAATATADVSDPATAGDSRQLWNRRQRRRRDRRVHDCGHGGGHGRRRDRETNPPGDRMSIRTDQPPTEVHCTGSQGRQWGDDFSVTIRTVERAHQVGSNSAHVDHLDRQRLQRHGLVERQCQLRRRDFDDGAIRRVARRKRVVGESRTGGAE